jgi:hypothetical protein
MGSPRPVPIVLPCFVALGCAGPRTPAPVPVADTAPEQAPRAPSKEIVAPAPAMDAASVDAAMDGAKDGAAADALEEPPRDAAPDVASFAPCREHPNALCDDFEGPAVGARPAAPWRVSGTGTLAIDDRVARIGCNP